MDAAPVLWSFRRCPYAMRARGAVISAGQTVELREILLRDKPDAFRRASPSATVPTLELPGQVIDESRDIMVWALERHDPDGLLDMPQEGWALIEMNDGPFKRALDHTKYAVRHPDRDAAADRAEGARFMADLNARLQGRPGLMGARLTLADHAIWPFVRQFANTDRPWFDAQLWPDLSVWLDKFTHGPRFDRIMAKFPLWHAGADPVFFGPPAN